MSESLQETRFAQLKMIFGRPKVEITKEFDPSFFEYFRSLFKDPARFDEYSKYCRRLFDRTEAYDRRVLDLGCGFGLMSINFALFGASMVYGVDLDETRLAVFRKILSMINPPIENVVPKCGSEHVIEFDDQYFDVVVAIDTISYVKHLGSVVLEVHRILRKNGVFFVSELNSIVNPFRRKNPYFDAKELKRMLRRKEERDSTREIFLAKERLARSQEVNPFAMKNLLKAAGFEAEIISPLRKHSSAGFVGNVTSKFLALVQLFHPISLAVAPYFNIEARKL